MLVRFINSLDIDYSMPTYWSFGKLRMKTRAPRWHITNKQDGVTFISYFHVNYPASGIEIIFILDTNDLCKTAWSLSQGFPWLLGIVYIEHFVPVLPTGTKYYRNQQQAKRFMDYRHIPLT